MRASLLKTLALMWALLSPSAIAQAPRDLSRLYGQADLAYWQTRYPVSTERIFTVFLDAASFLTEEEKRRLSEVQLRFPLYGAAPSGDPFTYYATVDPPAVTLPILSLKFLDDLSSAYAWLWVNGYSLETVADYVAMLKYKNIGSDAPPPLEALQIPPGALEDPVVDDMALRLFNSARAFILAHELGHVHLRHPGYGPEVTREQARRNEAEADRFALRLMSSTSTIPLGASLYFLTLAHWTPNRWDFQSEQAWEAYLAQSTHPLTAHRLQALAAGLDQEAASFSVGQPDENATLELIGFIADELAAIARLLEDEEVLAVIRAVGLATDLSSLAPRLPGGN